MKSNNKKEIYCSYLKSGRINSTLWTLTRRMEKSWQEMHQNATSNIEQILEATSHKTTAVRPPPSHH